MENQRNRKHYFKDMFAPLVVFFVMGVFSLFTMEDVEQHWQIIVPTFCWGMFIGLVTYGLIKYDK